MLNTIRSASTKKLRVELDTCDSSTQTEKVDEGYESSSPRSPSLSVSSKSGNNKSPQRI